MNRLLSAFPKSGIYLAAVQLLMALFAVLSESFEIKATLGVAIVLTSIYFVADQLLGRSSSVESSLDILAAKISPYFELTKPRLSFLVMVTMLAGMAAVPEAIITPVQLLALLSMGGIATGACVLNCYIEKDLDAQMDRTKDRVLPSGRLQPGQALIFGLSLSGISLIGTYLTTNLLTAALGLLAALLYLFAYTPLKKISPLAVYLGAVPGALPPLMGWTALTNQIDLSGILLFSILFFWQIPHFLVISLYYSEDYGKAGFPVYPNLVGNENTAKYVVGSTLMMCGIVFLPLVYIGWIDQYAVIALCLNVIMALLSFAGLLFPEEEERKNWARIYFFATIIYLPIILGSWIYFQ